MRSICTKLRWLCAVLAVTWCATAHAAFLDSSSAVLTGSTTMPVSFSTTLPLGAPFGVVDYAVYYNPTNADWTSGLTTVDLSGNGTTTTATYIYVFEVTNVTTSPPAYDIIEHAQISADPALVSSWGYIDGQSFADASGNIAADPLAKDPVQAAFAPTNIGTNPPQVDSISYDFIGTGKPLTHGQNSSLLFFTSPYGPTFYMSGLLDGVTVGTGLLPSPVPVPTTFALLLSGIPGLAGLGLVLRRRNHA